MGKQYKTAVYIGRFQPIHLAHLETIERALEKAKQLIIFVGTDNRPKTIKNPFSTEERFDIIKDAIKEYFGEELKSSWTDFPKASVTDRIRLVGCRDYKYNNYNWSSEIFSKALANGATSDKDTVLIGCKKDESSYYLEMFPQWTLDEVDYLYDLDATDVRNRVYEKGNIGKYDKYLMNSTVEYIEHQLNKDKFVDEYEYYQNYKEMHKFKNPSLPYNAIHNTVDTVVVKSGCILLVKRKFHPGINQYALPGGFLDEKEFIKDSALRELKEETRIDVSKSELEKQIKEYRYFDHPERSLRGRIITHAFMIDLGYGPLPDIKEGSDAKGAEWVPMADVMKMEDELFEDHYDIIVNMTSKIS